MGRDQTNSGPSSQRKKRGAARENHDLEVATRLQAELDNKVHHKSEVKTTRALAESLDSTYPEPVTEALRQLHHFAEEVIATKCHKCRTPLLQDFAVGPRFQGWIEKSKSSRTFSICAARCPQKSCRLMTCIGCGHEPRTKRYTATCNGMRLDYCCQQGRLFAFWVALCKYDETELQGQIASEANVTKYQAKAASGPNKSKGTGYAAPEMPSWDLFTMGPYNPFAMGFGGGWSGGYAARGQRKNHALSFQSTDKQTDAAIGMILNVIIELLPLRHDIKKKTPPALQAMIQLSLLLDKVADMLRNDSLRNVNDRANVYNDVFEFVKRLGKNDETSRLVCERRYTKKRSSGLQVISASESFDFKGKGNSTTFDEQSPLVIGSSKDDLATSVVGCMAKLASQAESLSDVTKGDQPIAMEFDTKAGRSIIETARTAKNLHKALAPLTYEARHSKKHSNGIAQWDTYHEKHRVDYDSSIERYLSPKISSQQAYSSPMNRMRRIVSEQVEMSTGLPQYIFLKVHDSRPDIMKCLMVGPEGTPYEGGLFESVELVCIIKAIH